MSKYPKRGSAKEAKSIAHNKREEAWRIAERINEFPYRPEFRRFNQKNNDLIAACYAAYLSGRSLQDITDNLYKGRFSRQTLFDAFKARGYKLRSKNLQPSKEYKGVIYRRDKNHHYRSRVGGKTAYLHRLIWEESHGPIPKNYSIIFKDGNWDNITLENMECRHRDEIKKDYNHGNQFGYKKFAGKGAFGKQNQTPPTGRPSGESYARL